MSDRFYFRQLLAGRDFAVGDDLATAMRNFTYALGDRESGEAMLVDPAYRVSELVDVVDREGMSLTGVIATHFHPDHVGGVFPGERQIEGIKELCDLVSVPVHVQSSEAPWIKNGTHVGDDVIVEHEDLDLVSVGEVVITLLHTPGHTPGSQCLLVEGRLVSGDTLFIDGCGRTDLPGGDARAMYRSLHQRLRAVSDETTLYPGHFYAPESSLSMAEVRERNFILAELSEGEWLARFGA